MGRAWLAGRIVCAVGLLGGVAAAGGTAPVIADTAGTVTAKVCDDGEILLHVPSEHVTAVCQQILALGAVDDITIQDVPLEDVITELFSRGVART